MRHLLAMFSFTLLFCVNSSSAYEHLAVNADGTVIITGGLNRVLYQHDPKTLKVIKRTRVNQPIRGLALNSDGSLIFSLEGLFRGELNVRDVKTGKLVKTYKGVGSVYNRQLVYSNSSQQLVYDANGKIHIISLKDGSEVTSFSHSKLTPQLMTISPDGKKLTIATKQMKNDEKREVQKTFIRDKIERETKRAKADGYGCKIQFYDLASGKLEKEYDTWFAPTYYARQKLVFDGDDVILFTSSDVNYRFDKKGTTSLFELGQLSGLGNGIALTPDGKKIVCGRSLATGVVIDRATKKAQKVTGAKQVPGHPEYYQRLIVTEKNQIFGLTSGLRIFRITDKLEMAPIEAIY